MTITLRSVKGSNLTAAEVDGNFTDLDTRVDALEASSPEPNNISNILVSGTQMTIVLDDATEFGPFTLPQANFRPSIVDTIADTTYEPVLADANGYLRCTNAAGCAVTVPASADVAFVVDTEITFRQAGAGAVTFDSPTDVTINVPSGFLAETAYQGATVTLKNVAEDEWDLIGALAEDATA